MKWGTCNGLDNSRDEYGPGQTKPGAGRWRTSEISGYINPPSEVVAIDSRFSNTFAESSEEESSEEEREEERQVEQVERQEERRCGRDEERQERQEDRQRGRDEERQERREERQGSPEPCACGGPQFHQWGPTSQCNRTVEEPEEVGTPELFSDVDDEPECEGCLRKDIKITELKAELHTLRQLLKLGSIEHLLMKSVSTWMKESRQLSAAREKMYKNKEILDLIKEQGKASAVHQIISKIKESKKPIPTEGAIYNKISKLLTTRQKLLKNKNRSTSSETFLDESFSIPIASPAIGIEKGSSRKRPATEDDSCKPSASSVFMAEALQLSSAKFARENQVLIEKNTNIEKDNIDLENKVRSVQLKLNKKESLKQNCKSLKLRNTALKTRICTKTKVLKQTTSRLQYYMNLSNSLRKKVEDKSCAVKALELEVARNVEQMKTLQTETNNAIAENEYLREMANDVPEVKTYDGYKYTAQMQSLIYELISCHVSTRKIPLVIKAVCSLLGKKVSHVPSRSTINNMSVQMISLSQSQLAEEFSERDNTTLLSDETTKYDQRVEGIHASDSDGREWVLGLRELETKSSEHVLTTFNEILKDIDLRSESAESEKSKQILGNIVAKMSDRAATELKLGRLIEEVRREVLPEVKEGYQDLTEEEKSDVGQLLVFSCGLHSLVHFAECCGKSLVEAEANLFPEKVPSADPIMNKPGESGTCRLIRTCSKAFARGGDAKNGVHLEFNAYVQPYLREHKLHTLPLAPFRGNRFNILFANASHVFFLRSQLTEFLDGRDNNRLLKAVLHDLKCPEFISGCKALGLISKYITTPLWSFIEDKSIHVMDMSKHYTKLVESLEYASNNMADFLEGRVLVFGEGTPINRDSCLEELHKPFEHDDLVQSMLLVMIPAVTKLCKKLFADHLPDGKFANVEQDSSLYHKTKSVPKHNKFAESIFAYMDCIMKARPNVSLLTCEALIMFTKNKTAEWLDGKDNKETVGLLSKARKARQDIAVEFKRRQNQIKDARRAETIRKQQESERKKQNNLQKLEKYTDSIVEHGLWQSLDQVDEMMVLYNSKKTKLEALKAQLNFRQYVLVQNSDKKLFVKSVGVEDMTTNVKKLIDDAGSRPSTSDRHVLVGKKIRHRLNTEENGVARPKWFAGKVCSQVTGYPAWFNVKYDEDDAIYTYRLGDDLERGDIQIVQA